MTLVGDLRDALEPDRVHSHPLELHLFGKDAGVRRGEPVAVAFPETTEETARCVQIARKWDVPVIPRGAGTGLAGGAVPARPALIVALTRMNRIHSVDRQARTAWVGPGVINLELSDHTRPLGLHFAPDPSSQAACTIGGNVSTNAGGPHCLAEGTTVAHVLALEFVTCDGEILVLGGEAPDPIGLDLRSVVVGSEGTLGVVTRVLVKLTQNAPAVGTLLMAYADIAGAGQTVSDVIGAGIVPAALEMMDKEMVHAVENFVHAGFPLDAAAVLLAEVAGFADGVEAETALIENAARAAGATEVRVAATDRERDAWWLGRKSAFGSVAQTAPDYYLHDTVVPRTGLADVLTEIYRIGERFGLRMLNVLHAGDGNLHPLAAFDAREPGALENVEAAAAEMVRVSVEAGGALSGEHGIGFEKRDLMTLTFSDVDLDAQARLREAFDPGGVFNPDKILPKGSRCYDFDLAVVGGP